MEPAARSEAPDQEPLGRLSERALLGASDERNQGEEINVLLKDKVAVIYGAGGAIGSAVSRAFAEEGAKLFLTGRHRGPVDAVAKEVKAADAAEVNALDEQAIDKHIQSVIEKAGRVDISFNAVGT